MVVAIRDGQARGFDPIHSHTGAQRGQAGVADLHRLPSGLDFSVTTREPYHKATSTPTDLFALNEHQPRTCDAVVSLTPRSDAGRHEFALNFARGRYLDVGASGFHKVKPKALCEITNAASKPKRLCLDSLSFNSVRCWDFMQGKASPCQLLSPQEPHCEKYPRRFTSVVSPERGSKISQVATPTDNDEATQTPASASRSRCESTTGLWTRKGLGVRTSIGAAGRLYERPSRDVTSGWSVQPAAVFCTRLQALDDVRACSSGDEAG